MKRILNILIIVSTLFTLSSCLKDKPLTDYVNIDPVVIIPNSNWPRSTAFTTAQTTKINAARDTSFTLYARVSWEHALSKDVVITMADAPTAVTDYNTKFNAKWTMLNADAYKVSNYKITVPAGKNDASVPFQIFGSKIDFTKSNMLAIAITDASGQNIGSNYKTYLVPITKQ
ncbi:MAG: DUF1735 domain-containing protein [Williamsia sp.]|nr:DUF1735 domain-containing protein [Williamsia sp.]